MACPAWFLLLLRTTGPGVTPPIAVWTLTYKSLIKKRPSQTCLQANSIEAVLQSRFLLPSYVLSRPNPAHPSQSIQRLTQMSVIFPPNHLPISLLSIHFPSHPIIYLPIHPQIYPNTHSSNPRIYLFHFSTFQWPMYSSSIRLLIHLSSTHPSSLCCTSSIHSSIHSPSILYLLRPHSMSNILMSFLRNSELKKMHSQVLYLLSLLSKGIGADKGNGTEYHKLKQSFEN